MACPPLPFRRVLPALVELENRGQSRQVLSRKSRRDQPLAERSHFGDLPGFDLFLVVILIVVVLILVVDIVVVLVIGVVDGILENVTARHFVTYEAGSAGGAGAAGAAAAAACAAAAAGFGGG
jgi:hypothetical protein